MGDTKVVAASMGLVVLAVLLLLVPQSQARLLHVAQTALPGIAQDSQVATIREAVAQIKAGDTVLVHSGVYREGISVDANGEPERPITIQAAEGQSVVISGADRITNWTPVPGQTGAYSTPWPHRFVAWNKQYTHPDDEYHVLIGRCEQVFVDGYPLRQVLGRDKLSRGSFFADIDAQRLYIQAAGQQDVAGDKAMVEASTRDRILWVKGSRINVKGIRFRYAANHAQQGAVAVSGDHVTIGDCVFEHTNASGVEFTGEDITVRSCTFQYNGQLGFGANRAHRLRLTGCTVRANNIKGFDRGWEAGGNKICLTRGAVLEGSVFVENRGNGIWFDIGNEDCEVRNCLIADNENAGIFYEISYGLRAHDNVIIGNGFGFTPGAWGANSGISLSSSPSCVIERNLILGNKEGFNFREQLRATPRIDGGSGPVWNHDQRVCNNVLAFNRDAQVWGWFDVPDNRLWPASKDSPSLPTGLSLENLNLSFEGNLYCPSPGQGLFNWGVTWKRHRAYDNLDALRKELSFDKGGKVAEFHVRDFAALDLRVPPDSPAVTMGCYPRGTVPGSQLGTVRQE